MRSKVKKINCRIIAAFILCFLFQSIANTAFCQDDESINIEQQLENITEAADDLETEDDSYLQSLHHFLKEPVNLNYADAGLLEQLHLLSPVQIANLLSYRKIFGLFINMYELQAIPGWSVNLIRKLRPYISVSEKIDLYSSMQGRLKSGITTLLIRGSQVLEKSKGYLLDSSNSTNFYQGSPQKLLIRYKYIFKNQLQYGFTAEKDAGEQFFKGSQRNGFDFYSAHFFVRNLGVIKSFALGDFAVNLGQGLIQWQSLAFNKGADIINVKRQSDVLRPYNSAGEIIFNRGAGLTVKKANWESTFFVSYRNLDAGFDVDTLSAEDKITSLHTSGYHRTESEIADKNVQGQFTIGGNFSFTNEKFHAGINAIQYHFDHPIKKPGYLYNKYAVSGSKLGNYSLDYSYTFKNLHIFGEGAVDNYLDKALITGLLISTDSKVDMSFLYRNISKSYQSLYSNAFTENSSAVNERGFYSGITINPTDFLRIDGYADFFHFPWLKYRTDAPTSGNDYMLQSTYKPDKQIEFMIRYKAEMKPINYNPNDLVINPVTGKTKQNLRIQYAYKLDRELTTRSRVELCWFDKKGNAPENGFLIYTDLIYKPLMKKYSGNIRGMYFETDGYNSRLYAFENDVLYGYSIPVFFDKGFRYYININYDFNEQLSGWIRVAQTVYPEKTFYGSGLDLINKSKKTECKVQLLYTFAKN
jgi:hypothetical protein